MDVSVQKARAGRQVDECRSIKVDDCLNCPVRCRGLLREMEFETLAELHRTVPSQHCKIKARDFLYQKGEEFSANIVIFHGWVVLYREHVDGGRQIFHIALPGDFVPVQFSRSHRVDHTAQAVTNVTICAFDRQSLFNEIVNKPMLSKSLAAYEESILEMCGAHVECLGRKSAEGRIAYLLLSLCDRVLGRPVEDDESVFFPLTQEHLADWAGITHVHVNRTINRLRDIKLLDCHHRNLTILDRAQMDRLAGLG